MVLQSFFLHPVFSGVFHSSEFSESRFFSVRVFQDPGFSGSRFFSVQAFQGPGFSGPRSTVWVQVLEVANSKTDRYKYQDDEVEKVRHELVFRIQPNIYDGAFFAKVNC